MILRRLEVPLRIVGQPLLGIACRVFFGLRLLETRHLPRRGPVLVVANHQGYLDPVFVQMALPRPIRYLMTSDFYDMRRIQPFFRLIGAIRVGNGTLNRGALKSALEVLDSGGVVGIFPEGRLSRDGSIGRLHPGTAYLAAKSGAPVVPARIDGSFRVLRRGEWLPRQASVTIRFAAPLGFTDPRDRTAEEKILEAWRLP